MKSGRVGLRPWHLALCLAGIVAGLAIFIAGVAEWRDSTQLLASGVRAEARVIEIHRLIHGDRVSYEFRAHKPGTRGDGRYRGLRESVGFAAAAQADASGRIEISYDPENPEINRVVDSGTGWGYAAILLVVLCLIGYPVHVLVRDLSWRRHVLSKGNPREGAAATIFCLIERRANTRHLEPPPGPEMVDRTITIRVR